MLAIHFGAGNIGRGFIGQLLHESNYKICFIDVNQTIINDINRLQKYQIEFVSNIPTRIEIDNIYALNINDVKKVVEEIVNADIITTALGVNALQFIAPIIAKGIMLRLKKVNKSLNIIACENMINASSKLEEFVYQYIDKKYVNDFKKTIGFPNAAVDRIVPIQHNSKSLLVKTESFYEWDVENSSVIGEKPNIKGITYVDNLQAYIERKLFAVNATHAAMAYLGNLYGEKTIYGASSNSKVMEIVQNLTKETGALLAHKYNFKIEQHNEYIKMIISRFSNPHISDEITRVARSPIRKIGFNERLVAPARELENLNLPNSALIKIIASVFYFNNKLDSESIELQNFIKKYGIRNAIITYCNLKSTNVLVDKIEKEYTLMLSRLS